MTPEQWAEKIAEQLRGTCDRLQAVLALYDREDLENDAEFCAGLDARVFECQRCNWWFEQSEMAERKDDEWICEDCTEDNERS